MSVEANEPACPVCANPVGEPVCAHTDFASSHIFRCAQCRHAYCWPEPSHAQLDEHYSGKYASKRLLYIGPEYRRMMDRRARAQVEFISRHVARAGTAIDVGCGIGALTSRLNQLGWAARGFDSDVEAITYGSSVFSCRIEPGSLSEFFNSSVQYDLVCMSHVLEHLTELGSTLQRVIQTIRPGGCLFIEVPNDTKISESDLESHVHFFSRQSLSRALSAAGLEVLECSCCGPPEHTVVTAPKSVLERAGRSLAVRVQRLFRRTVWDGWYDRYDKGDVGIWMRCIARRPIRGAASIAAE